jgi:hypothetical protein
MGDEPVKRPQDHLGLRVVWDTPGFSPAERAALEALLTRILAEGLLEAYANQETVP